MAISRIPFFLFEYTHLSGMNLMKSLKLISFVRLQVRPSYDYSIPRQGWLLFPLLWDASASSRHWWQLLRNNKQISIPMEYCHKWSLILVLDGAGKFCSYITLIVYSKSFNESLLLSSVLSMIRKIESFLKGGQVQATPSASDPPAWIRISIS